MALVLNASPQAPHGGEGSRRLRSRLRHERMSVAMALAEKLHHIAQRPEMARAGEEESEMKYTAKFWTTPPPQPELFQLFEEEPGGGLPAPLSEVAGRQDKVVRHVMEDLGSVCPVVQILDLPVPHMVDQLAELLNLEEDVLDAGRLVDRFFQVPELVIEVPKISLDVIPLRALVPEPQLAEQLVEVPTIVSPFLRCSGLWSRPWTFQFRRVVEVVSVSEVFKVPQDRVQQRVVVQISLQRLPSRTLTFQFRVVTELFILHRHLPFCR